MPHFDWITPSLRLTFSMDADAPVALASIRPSSSGALGAIDPLLLQPLVEISTIGHGRFPGGFRHVDTTLGAALRLVDHRETVVEGVHELRIRQLHAGTGLIVVSVLRAHAEVAGFQSWTEVRNAGGAPVTLDSVSSFATGAFLIDTSATVDDFDLVHGDNDWVAESRWQRKPLRDVGLARIDRELQHHPPRSRCSISNRGSWSTGEKLPTGVLLARDQPYALAWQIEHNGPWTYELGERRHGAYLLLSGPTDQEHHWSRQLALGDTFTSVPASVAVAAGGLEDAFAVLTEQRRAIRHRREADRALPVIFNDYMNTLMGDPTTEKLLPLIDAAAAAGADYFCIDAGWYAEGSWWDSVGEWQPVARRFPAGITEVIEHIRARGMVAGLWLEPEVIGINSPLARTLPDDAFFSRGGVRVAEHGRHLLDLRSPSALAHVNEVVDRLVCDYGVGFFKMDYNTMTGPGTDATGGSPGDGLLEHNRAVLDWLDDVQVRHPHLLIENCASGAMRMDYAMMSRLHLQSTSDQQDPVKYAPIAAAAPASLLPEQAGNWAYPQTGMDAELLTFSLANAVLGRMYLSGYLNRMSEAEVAVVREAVRAQKTVLTDIERSHAVWPLGLPGWEDPWLAMGLGVADGALRLTVWRRPGAEASVVLPLPTLRGEAIEIEPFFPAAQQGWAWSWDATAGELTLTATVAAPTARVFSINRH
ncbi:glycoside hydrolase family 36 protein [Leifsonia sp. Root112D2]|uniref:glycoside hydrolase family 36 protein n=1 Tax=Leifsonia sp. Root112D2 TaxID=1736426 RepID=UPI0006F4628A|nr:glycoside hydrolase family 36 protein [Leifsonia sp. Root112D2]KQV06472.1 hypothetical protein ASC63_03280 [Leifsonia sp. Root112D2]